ncbi:MAG: C39 family peptidase, partial [Oscillospiraceae bacterium]
NKMESYVFKSSFYPLDYKRASPIKRKTVNSIMATAFWQFSANGDNINTRIRINKMLGKPILNTEDKKVIDVPYISQKGILPNGCESVSATMLLQYYGFEITPQKFISDYLVKSPVKVKWGCRYGPNPKLAYAGDPRSEKNSYGCFAPVIEKSLNDYMPEDYFAQTFKNKSLETLAHDYIDNDIPVLVWATVGMDEVDKILQWQSYDKKETFLYPSNEHCMVFVGYDENNYYFNDPYNSNGVIGYPKEKAISSYNSLGCQAVIINKEIFD